MRAREAQAEYLSEEIIEIADDGRSDWMAGKDGERVLDHEHVQRSKLRVDSRKWLMARMAPKRYGDSVRHAHGGDADAPPMKHDVAVSSAEAYRRMKDGGEG